MIGKNILKWIAGAALLVATVPAIGQARSHHARTAAVHSIHLSAKATRHLKTSSHKKHVKHSTLHKKTSAIHKKHAKLHVKRKVALTTATHHLKSHHHKHAHRKPIHKKA